MDPRPTKKPDPEERTPRDLLGPLNDVEEKYAPDRIYVRGDTSLLSRGPRVAVIGTRDVSEDGLARARRVAALIVKHKGVVVSGLAAGVDRSAHETAIARGGSTIAVIGTGFDRAYPMEHADLQETIARDHLLVTQFARGVPIEKGNFVRRNRLMALLSHASIIIEAKDSSGTLSQGWEMLRLGRSLFLLQSLVNNTDLSWPKEMLRYGAMVLSDPSELEEWLDQWSDIADASSF